MPGTTNSAFDLNRYQKQCTEFREVLLVFFKKLNLDKSAKDFANSFEHRRDDIVDFVSWVLPRFILRLALLWCSIIAYIYFHLPRKFFRSCLKVSYVLFQHGAKCSPAVRKFEIHAIAICDLLVSFFSVIVETKISLLIIDVLQCICDIISSWLTSSHIVYVPTRTNTNKERVISSNKGLSGLSDVVYYEEQSPKYQNINNDKSNDAESTHIKNKMKQTMHHYVSPRMFRAAVRVSKKRDNNKRDSTVENNRVSSKDRLIEHHSKKSTRKLEDKCSIQNFNIEEQEGPHSPASFPPTPFSRARVMNKNTELVISMLFATRDSLRLEAQSTSRDEYSRRVAVAAKSSKKTACYDAKQTSEGLALTCGNHCVLKVSNKLCCSSKAMISIVTGAYVYFEFSITTSNACQTLASLCMGLSSSQTPLDSMVGTSIEFPSIGLHTEGKYLIQSKSFQDENMTKINHGSTVGFLVYIPSENDDTDNFTTRQENKSYEERIENLEKNNENNDMVFNINVNGDVFKLNGPALNSFADAISSNRRSTKKETLLYPTVSLLSHDTRVWCRFCEADMVCNSRSVIGAPKGVKVYCLDGSLLIPADK